MKRIVLPVLLNVVVTMSVLIAGTYFATIVFIDPSIQSLADALVVSGTDIQDQVMPHLVNLERLRGQASLYFPLAFCLAAVMAILLVLPFIRRKGKKAAVQKVKEKEKAEPRQIITQQDLKKATDSGALLVLSILQEKGRLIDFLEEEIGDFDDAQIGAAVRQIHGDCKEALHEYLTLVSVFPEEEGEMVTVPKGFDASECRLSGHVVGEPPYKGVLQHGGWKVTEIDLPVQSKGRNAMIIAPADVEVGA